MLSAISLTLALFVTAASAGKRGLAWPWCMSPSQSLTLTYANFHSQTMVDCKLESCTHSTRSHNCFRDPGVLNNGQGQVVAM